MLFLCTASIYSYKYYNDLFGNCISIKYYISQKIAYRFQMQANDLKNSQNFIEIYLRLDNGNGCKLNVNAHSKLSSLITLIQGSQLQVPSGFQLVLGGKVLSVTQERLDVLGVRNKSIIHIENVIPNSQKQIKIDVWVYYNGEKLVIRCKTVETIYNLKKKLFRILGILPKYQLIVFRGLKLQNQQNLNHYHIKSNSLLCLRNQTPNVESIPHTGIQDSFLEFKPNKQHQILDCVSSVDILSYKRPLNCFRSESFDDRPVYQIEIHEHQDESLSSGCPQDKDFHFELLSPNLGDILQKGDSKQQDSSIVWGMSNSIQMKNNMNSGGKGDLQDDFADSVTASYMII